MNYEINMVEKQLEELTPTQAKRFAIQTVQSELKTRGLELTGFAVNAVVDEAIKTARTKITIFLLLFLLGDSNSITCSCGF